MRIASAFRRRSPSTAPSRCRACVPVPEGFTYYLRADLGWGFSTSRKYGENGALYGAERRRSCAHRRHSGFGGSGFGAVRGDAKGDDVFLGTVGYGAYFTPRLRGDLTIDFRSRARPEIESTYTYASTRAAHRRRHGDRQDQDQQRGDPGQPVLGPAAARLLHALHRRRHRLRLQRCDAHLQRLRRGLRRQLSQTTIIQQQGNERCAGGGADGRHHLRHRSALADRRQLSRALSRGSRSTA